MELYQLWKTFLDRMKEKLSPILYDTWFSETKLHSLNNSEAIVIVPSPIHIRHLSEKYYDLIAETFNEVTGTNFKLKYILDSDVEKIQTNTEIERKHTGTPLKQQRSIGLKTEYTFDNYVVGDSNKFASYTAMAVAEEPGQMYNPLFIYGKSGLGKTHLMHAIGNYILNNDAYKTIIYVSSEGFVNEFIEAINTNTLNTFKDKYRAVDVLIIDDIQFLSKKDKSQEEFFHTFNALYDQKKQIIISSDRSPQDLQILEERLRTRFSGGLSVEILTPEYETRIAILKKKIAARGLTEDIPFDVVQYIASIVQSDVRELNGALNTLFAYATVMKKSTINIELAMEALNGSATIFNTGKASNNRSIAKIQQIVADYYRITVDEIKSKRRVVDIAYPRQIAMYLCRELTEHSFPKIGSDFGGRDHTTVIHACDKIKKQLTTDSNLQKAINDLKSKIK